MSAVRWIKVSVAMFDDEKIRLIEALPDADSVLVIWMKLLTLAAKVNAGGHIYLNEAMPYTDEMLATIFNRKVNTVRMALSTFLKFEMIEVTESKTIVVKNWAKHQNIDGLDKIRADNLARQKKHRSRSKNGISLDDEASCDGQVTLPVTLPSRDVTQQKKKESGNVTSHVTLEGEREEEKRPPTVPQGGQDVGDSIESVEEAKALICTQILNGKDPARRWSDDAMEALSSQLPIPRTEFNAVAWFHGLPPNDDIPELRDRRRSETTLMKYWSDEVTRARCYLAKIDGQSPNQATRLKEPKDWQEIFKKIFSDRPPAPQSFWNLQVDERRAINEQIEKRKKGPALWREFFASKYDFPHLPQTFAELPQDLRKEWDLQHDAFEQSADWWQPIAVTLWGERDDLPNSISRLSKTARAEVLQTFWKKVRVT